jgi:hypothetical protein
MTGPRAERGSAALEFAMVLPILLVLTLALVQVGLLVRDQLVLVQATRAGAREAAVNEDDDDAREAALDAAGVLDTDRIRVVIERGGGQGGPAKVKLEYADPISVPFVDWLFPDEVTMHADATMRQEFG